MIDNAVSVVTLKHLGAAVLNFQPEKKSVNLINLSSFRMKLYFNCSFYEFENEVRNVTQNWEAMGATGKGIAWFGLISSISLIILFFLQFILNFKKCPREWRRPLSWIGSFPMYISIISWIVYCVPRFELFHKIFKEPYLLNMYMRFLDLVFIVGGGEDKIVEDLIMNKQKFKLYRAAWYFFLCKQCSNNKKIITKKSFRHLRETVYLAPLLQLIVTTMQVLMKITQIDVLVPRWALNVLSCTLAGFSFFIVMLCTWDFAVLINAISELHKLEITSNNEKKTWFEKLRRQCIEIFCNRNLQSNHWNNSLLRKTIVLIAFITIMKMQNLILNVILMVNHAQDFLPCLPPVISPTDLKQTFDAVLCLFEAFFSGWIFLFVFLVPSSDFKEKFHKTNGLNEETPLTSL